MGFLQSQVNRLWAVDVGAHADVGISWKGSAAVHPAANRLVPNLVRNIRGARERHIRFGIPEAHARAHESSRMPS